MLGGIVRCLGALSQSKYLVPLGFLHNRLGGVVVICGWLINGILVCFCGLILVFVPSLVLFVVWVVVE